MSKLSDYVLAHAERGECQCGRCADVDPNKPALVGHTADTVFFKVRLKDEVVAADLKKLVEEHKGDYGDVNVFDGKEHGYIELGAWIGDQGLALILMGMGELVGLWQLLTPYSMFGKDFPAAMAMEFAGQGLLTIKTP
jgi:hypothetical protein